MGKYERVYQDLVEKIEDGTYTVGNLLPSEHQLTQTYGVSRETARKALAILTERGYIQKIMGKGSIVINHSHYALPLHTLTSYKEISINSPGVSTEVLSIEQSTAPHTLFADLAPEAQEEPATRIIRLRHLDGAPTIIDTDYLLTSVIPYIPEHVAKESLYEYIENELGLPIGYSNRQMKVEAASEKDRTLLRLAKGESVVVTRSATYLEDTRLFQYTESRHRADKFVFRSFARRR